jgi:hypothetical protein
MKTTIEIPDLLFRKVKSRAAERGLTLKDLVTEALREKLASNRSTTSAEPEWMQGFAKLRRLHRETQRVAVRVEEAFEVIESEDRE